MVTSDAEKNTQINKIISANDQSKSGEKSPWIAALVRFTTGVNGAIQLRVFIMSGKDDRGKNTPLKKNIGVINRLKK